MGRRGVRGSKLFITSVALLLLSAGAYGVGALKAQPGRVQDLLSLERRVSLMEQRFYAIESRLNRLEQPPAAPRRDPAPVGARDSEINLLSTEVEQLRRRLLEVECGVVRLDERTKEATGKSGDPCRQNPRDPVKLSVRP